MDPKPSSQESSDVSFEVTNETFRKYFPEGVLTQIKEHQIPSDVLEFMRQKNEVVVEKESFDQEALLIQDSEGKQTYCVAEKYRTGRDVLFLVDVHHGIITGYGEIKDVKDQTMQQSVGYTFTFEDYRGQGIGTRRLLLMNALCHALCGAPLYSGRNPSGLASSIWDKLVESGKAKKFTHPGGDVRYAFID